MDLREVSKKKIQLHEAGEEVRQRVSQWGKRGRQEEWLGRQGAGWDVTRAGEAGEKAGEAGVKQGRWEGIGKHGRQRKRMLETSGRFRWGGS